MLGYNSLSPIDVSFFESIEDFGVFLAAGLPQGRFGLHC